MEARGDGLPCARRPTPLRTGRATLLREQSRAPPRPQTTGRTREEAMDNDTDRTRRSPRSVITYISAAVDNALRVQCATHRQQFKSQHFAQEINAHTCPEEDIDSSGFRGKSPGVAWRDPGQHEWCRREQLCPPARIRVTLAVGLRPGAGPQPAMWKLLAAVFAPVPEPVCVPAARSLGAQSRGRPHRTPDPALAVGRVYCTRTGAVAREMTWIGDGGTSPARK